MASRPLLRLCCSVLLLLPLVTCSMPAPEKVELYVPEDARSDVEVTVTLYELPSDGRVFQETYSVAPGETVSVAEFEDGVDYRVALAINGSTVWSDRIAAREFVTLEVYPNGTVQDGGGGTYAPENGR